eukprot:scaffold120004_cov63-Phaeocystis_antarctica.AAC.1
MVLRPKQLVTRRCSSAPKTSLFTSPNLSSTDDTDARNVLRRPLARAASDVEEAACRSRERTAAAVAPVADDRLADRGARRAEPVVPGARDSAAGLQGAPPLPRVERRGAAAALKPYAIGAAAPCGQAGWDEWIERDSARLRRHRGWGTQAMPTDWQQDAIIEALDMEGKWYAAKVVYVASHSVMVHYHGWSSKWNEWLERDSNPDPSPHPSPSPSPAPTSNQVAREGLGQTACAPLGQARPRGDGRRRQAQRQPRRRVRPVRGGASAPSTARACLATTRRHRARTAPCRAADGGSAPTAAATACAASTVSGGARRTTTCTAAVGAHAASSTTRSASPPRSSSSPRRTKTRRHPSPRRRCRW